jgi:hypothetical protein
MLHIIIEDEAMASIHQEMKRMSTKQLILLEELIKREKEKRKTRIFNEWLGKIKEIKAEFE